MPAEETCLRWLEIQNLNELPDEVKKNAALAGINPDEQERSGSFFQQDQSILCAKSTQPGSSCSIRPAP